MIVVLATSCQKNLRSNLMIRPNCNPIAVDLIESIKNKKFDLYPWYDLTYLAECLELYQSTFNKISKSEQEKEPKN